MPCRGKDDAHRLGWLDAGRDGRFAPDATGVLATKPHRIADHAGGRGGSAPPDAGAAGRAGGGVSVIILGGDPRHAHQPIAAGIGDGAAIALHVVLADNQGDAARNHLAALMGKDGLDKMRPAFGACRLINRYPVRVQRGHAGINHAGKVRIFAFEVRVAG